MPTLTFAFNDNTFNTNFEVLEEALMDKVKDAKLKITCLKSYDDDDYYEFDINEDECTISNLEFDDLNDNCWTVSYEAKITISKDKWENADSNFKKNAEDGMIEVDFDLEVDGELYELNDHFEKQSDGQTELFID